uniref:Uncharacterized protein n=1 Tax=Anguilla anguilla TaxID=7936 RepID=A0A0E9WYF2_ANGAN
MQSLGAHDTKPANRTFLFMLISGDGRLNVRLCFIWALVYKKKKLPIAVCSYVTVCYIVIININII